MRTRVWNNLANIKFKALYTSECSKLAGTCGRIYSFLFAFTSTSSAATWAIWNRYPFFWAFIVGFSQLLSVIKPHIPFVKNDKAYLEMSFEFEWLYLEYERLWYDIENQRLKEPQAEAQFYKLRQKEIEIEKRHKDVVCPRSKYYMDKVTNETLKALEINFGGSNYAERSTVQVAATTTALSGKYEDGKCSQYSGSTAATTATTERDGEKVMAEK